MRCVLLNPFLPWTKKKLTTDDPLPPSEQSVVRCKSDIRHG